VGFRGERVPGDQHSAFSELLPNTIGRQPRHSIAVDAASPHFICDRAYPSRCRELPHGLPLPQFGVAVCRACQA